MQRPLAPGAARSARSVSTAPLSTSVDSDWPRSTRGRSALAVPARMRPTVPPTACPPRPGDDRRQGDLWVVFVGAGAGAAAPNRRRSGWAIPGSARLLMVGRRQAGLAGHAAADESTALAPDAGAETATTASIWPADLPLPQPLAVTAAPLAHSRRSAPPGGRFFSRLAGLALQHHQDRIRQQRQRHIAIPGLPGAYLVVI